MGKVFFYKDKKFTESLKAFLQSRRSKSSIVSAQVSKIISAVREHGDKAVANFTNQFDNFNLLESGLFFSQMEIQESDHLISQKDKNALTVAIDRITLYHKKQMPIDVSWTDDTGVSLGWKWKPIERAGIYAPGGKASYPSSVLMNIIPAKIEVLIPKLNKLSSIFSSL